MADNYIDLPAQVTTINGLTGNLTLSATNGVQILLPSANNLQFSLTNTGVNPGTYGDQTYVGKFIVDIRGRLTYAENVQIYPFNIPTPRVIVYRDINYPSATANTFVPVPGSGPINSAKVYANWYSQDLRFLDYNPQYFLFRYVRRKNKGSSPSYRARRNRFVHGPNLGTDNGLSIYGGEQYWDQAPLYSFSRKTRWDVNSDWSVLTEIDFSPLTYYKPISWSTFDYPTPPGILPADFPILGNPRDTNYNSPPRRKWLATGNVNNSYRTVFKLAMAVENYQWTSDNHQARWFVGPLSDTFVVEPVVAYTAGLVAYTIGYAIRIV